MWIEGDCYYLRSKRIYAVPAMTGLALKGRGLSGGAYMLIILSIPVAIVFVSLLALS